uniref:DNA ligase n=1 Tax=Ochrobactrum phage ORM_20 TaxID=2985243 RepID=A0A9N6WS70_9VIRU|nr:DNA ligase [Ochrobactrum phage ORM_20]
MNDIFLSSKEEQIINLLGQAWNIFLELDGDYHDDEIDRFRANIHNAQNQIMARPTRRFMKELKDYRNSKPDSPMKKALRQVKSDERFGTLSKAIAQNALKMRQEEVRKVLEPYVGVFFSKDEADKLIGTSK